MKKPYVFTKNSSQTVLLRLFLSARLKKTNNKNNIPLRFPVLCFMSLSRKLISSCNLAPKALRVSLKRSRCPALSQPPAGDSSADCARAPWLDQRGCGAWPSCQWAATWAWWWWSPPNWAPGGRAAGTKKDEERGVVVKFRFKNRVQELNPGLNAGGNLAKSHKHDLCTYSA